MHLLSSMNMSMHSSYSTVWQAAIQTAKADKPSCSCGPSQALKLCPLDLAQLCCSTPHQDCNRTSKCMCTCVHSQVQRSADAVLCYTLVQARTSTS